MSYASRDRVAIKMNTKATVDKMKFGSPKLKQVLRQRCRDRLREKRNELFNSKRLGNSCCNDESFQDTLTEIVRKELSDLKTMEIDQDIRLLAATTASFTHEEALELEQEIIAEGRKWILDDYEKMEENDQKLLSFYGDKSMEIEVICPICEKTTIKETENGLSCHYCQFYLSPTISLKQFAIALEHHLYSHAKFCSERPSFMALPEDDTISLCISCYDCHSFANIR